MIESFDTVLETLIRTKNLEKDQILNLLKEVTVRSVSDYYNNTQVEIIPDEKHKFSVLITKKAVKRVKDPATEISIQEAKKYDSKAIEGSQVKIYVPINELPRAVIYRIRDRFVEKLRDIERQSAVKEFSKMVGELVIGVVQRTMKKEGAVILYIKKSVGSKGELLAEGYLSNSEMLPGEFEKLKQGEKKEAVIIGIDEKRHYVLLSRTHPDFLKRILEKDNYEIQDGTIEIKQVARIPGKRSKVAVFSREARIDPVGAMVGSKGTRLNNIQKELLGEKIEIIKWDSDTLKFAANALQPSAHIITAYKLEDKIYVVVSDENIKEAKGSEGLNVILASKLVGKEIVIIPLSEYTKPKGIVTLIEITKAFPPSVYETLLRNGFYSFSEEPTLASLYKIGIDEKTALKIIEFIEEKLNE